MSLPKGARTILEQWQTPLLSLGISSSLILWHCEAINALDNTQSIFVALKCREKYKGSVPSPLHIYINNYRSTLYKTTAPAITKHNNQLTKPLHPTQHLSNNDQTGL
jgi:hypothetical protein